MSFNSSPFIHNGLAASTNPDRCRQRGAGAAHRSERTMCGEKKQQKTDKAAYPEDEIEEEEHVLDAFGAAFDSHGEPLDGDIRRLCEDGGQRQAR